MATIVNERTRFRGGRKTIAGVTALALAVVVGLGIWQTQPATNQPATVEQTEAFSPEAVRVRNAAGLAQEEALSPELMRIRNLADKYEREAFSPELVRMRNSESFVLGSD